MRLAFERPRGNHRHTMFHLFFMALPGKGRFEVPHKSFHTRQLGIQAQVDIRVRLDLINHLGEVHLYVFALPGPEQQTPLPARKRFPLHQANLITLIRKTHGGCHTGYAGPHHQCPLVDFKLCFHQGFHECHLGHRHAHQVPGLFRGHLGIIFVHPGILIPDVGHLKEVFVKPRSHQGLLEQRLMGLGSAGGHHNAVEVIF